MTTRKQSIQTRLIAILLMVLSVGTATVRAQTCDSTEVEPAFRAGQLVLPSAMIAVGAFGVDNGWFCGLKNDLRGDFNDLRGDHRMHGDNILRFLPAAAHVGLGLAGVESRHPLRERIAVSATAFAAVGVLVGATKRVVSEKRPDASNSKSFPSGHTAIAFMGAELVREEYGNAYGTGAYAVATAIAFMRLYNDQHWLNDVIGGAGFGLLSARVGYWLLPWERRLLGWDKRKDGPTVAILPAYQTESRAPMLCIAASW